MKYRVLIFDDNDAVRSVLYQFINGVGIDELSNYKRTLTFFPGETALLVTS